jgi:hypothetical protein
MTDLGFVEDLINGEQFALDSTVNNFSFVVPEVMVDLDRNESNSVDESVVNNSSVFEEVQSVSDSSSVVHECDILNTASVFSEETTVTSSDVLNETQNFLNANECTEVFDENTNILNESTNVFNEVQNFAENAGVVNEIDVVNAGAPSSVPPVTVNFNAYNEFRAGGNSDVDSVMNAFCDRLSEAVAIAAEGVRF